MPSKYALAKAGKGLGRDHCQKCGTVGYDEADEAYTRIRNSHPEWSRDRAWARAWIETVKAFDSAKLKAEP